MKYLVTFAAWALLSMAGLTVMVLEGVISNG